MKKRGEFALENLGWWILALIVLVIMILGYMVLKGKGDAAIDYLKNLLQIK